MNSRTLTLMACSTLALTLSACSQSPKKEARPAINQSFHTEIAEDGSKRFRFTISVAEKQQRKSKRPSREKESSGSRHQKMEKRFHDQLEQHLERTGFCREGYVVLDSNFSRSKGSIRGECRESATQQDRESLTSQNTL